MTGSSAVTRPLAGTCTSMPTVAANVNVGLPVRHDQNFFTGERLVEHGSQRVRRPAHTAFVARAAVRFQIADQLMIAGERLELRRDRVAGAA